MFVKWGMDIKSEFKSLIKEDKRISDTIRIKNLPPTIRKLSEIIAHSADNKFWWPLIVLIWIFGNTFWKHWAVTIAIGIGLIGIALWAIKHLVQRERPVGLWSRKARDKDPHSFPSGHAGRTFLLAVLATGLGPAWLAVLFWIWAPLLSLSRVAMGVHYLSDVIGGMLLAIIVGALWLHFHEAVLAFLLSFFLTVLHIPLW